MTRITIALTGTLFALLAVFTAVRAQDRAAQEPREPDVVVHVKGMACPLCARNMRKAISKVDGVEAVEVLLEEQKVLVTLKEGQEVSEEVLKEAVTGAGYVFQKAVFLEKKSAGENGG